MILHIAYGIYLWEILRDLQKLIVLEDGLTAVQFKFWKITVTG